MRSPSSPAFRPRRVLAVAGLLSLGSGLLMLTAAAHPVQAAASVGKQSATTAGAGSAGAGRLAGHRRTPAKPSPAAVKQFQAQERKLAAVTRTAGVSHSPTTVTGPHMYDPATGKQFPNASTVTVGQTASLVNQQITVSWTNFTPSSSLVYGASNVAYPVMVAECKGTNPSSPADCYGAENGGVTSTSGQFGPMNAVYATTGPDGTGITDIDILAKQENQFLNCQTSTPCSLAIVPSQGGNYSKTPPDCADHSQDFSFGTGYAVGAEAFGSLDFSCSWAQRIVVKLGFSRVGAVCPIKNFAFSVVGSPMLARAMDSWDSALCVGSHGVAINYGDALPEPAALTDLGTGQADVALTTRTASAQGISTGTKHYLYAPVAVTAVAIPYWFDNPATGLADTGIELDQRLVLKLLTQSYAFLGDGCPPVSQGTPCDGGVDHNPADLFVDPEFTRINPEFASQNGQAPQVGAPTDGDPLFPIVQSGQSDMTWEVTNWIDADKHASEFLGGQFDPWGMHLNTFYKGLTYPNNTFVGQDPFSLDSYEYSPVFPLSTAANDMVENWPPGDSPFIVINGNHQRLSVEIPGQRALIAIIDQGDASAFLMPDAKIPNGAGNYEAPTTAHMLAALKGMTKAGSGTLQVNLNSKVKNAYPLTMVVYAVVPTSGTSHNKAAAIARWLDFAAGAGQTTGVQPGQLPPGYAPLPASMRAQARKDAYDVLHQTGATAPKTTNNNTGTGASPAPSPTGSPGSVALPTVGPSPGPGSGISLVNAADAQPASITRYILPALLILGGLAALAGSSSLIGSSSTPITVRLRRIGQGTVAWSRAARSRLGLRRSK